MRAESLISMKLFVICLSLFLSLSALAIAAEYQYTEIKPPLGWSNVYPVGINDNGAVFGAISSDIPFRHGFVLSKAFIYKNGFHIKLLPSIPHVGSIVVEPEAMNNRGTLIGEVLVGHFLIPSPVLRIGKGFIYRLGIYTMLSPPGFRYSEAADINDESEVVGSAFSGAPRQGFLYKNGTYTMLLPPGWTTSDALKINNNGVVLGLVPGQGIDIAERGFLYKDGKYTELLPPGWSSVAAIIDFNDSNAVIGIGFPDPPEVYNRPLKAFLYLDGQYTELLPPGGSNSVYFPSL